MSRKTYFSRMIGMKSSANKAVDECFQHMFASPEIAWVSNICFKIKKTDFLVKHGTERQCLGIYIITNNMRACVCIWREKKGRNIKGWATAAASE